MNQDAESDAKNVEETVSADASRVWPDEVFTSFFRIVEPRALWAWLREDEQFALLQEIARGFQQSAKALGQPLVRARLKSHLEREPATRENIEKWWRDKPGKGVCQSVANIENEASWQTQSADIVQQFGREYLILAAFFDARFSFSQDETPVAQTPDRVLDTSQKALSNKPLSGFNTQFSQLASDNETLKTRAQNAENEALQSRRESEKLTLENKRFKTESERQKHLFDKREADLLGKIGEAQKQAEREARRARQLEKLGEEQSLETKRLKRLVRQSQLLQEETRRQVALLQAQLEESQPKAEPPKSEVVPSVVAEKFVKPKKSPRAPKPLFGRNEVFTWKTVGREVRVSPREIKERIDQNDEKFVANLARDIEVLRESDDVLAKRFRSSVREVGRYYNRVLDGATTRVLVDASNVARYEKDGRNRGQLCHLLAMRDELRRYDCFPILFFADASLVHNINEPDELKAMARRGELEIVTTGTEADDILARRARESGASVVTNDRNFHGRVAPDWEPSRIGFHIRDGIVVLEGLD